MSTVINLLKFQYRKYHIIYQKKPFLEVKKLILLTIDHSSGKKNPITLPVVTFTKFYNSHLIYT